MPLLETHIMTIQEPSDVAIDDTGTILWTVTKQPQRVYQLDLTGNVIKELSYHGTDLEGVAYDPRDKTLWILEEESREVIHLDLTGAELGRSATLLTGQHNHGLEGICLSDSGVIFVVNEKSPGLFMRLKSDLTENYRLGLGFARDFSGIAYDIPRQSFWITSDESQRLYRWTPNQVIEQYSLPFAKPEGVAYDPAHHRIYVVSDATNGLYVFDSSPAAAFEHSP